MRAGFLTALNYNTTVMMRSIPLRGFDQECASKIVAHMEEHGTKFLRGCVPTRFEKLPSGQVRVTWSEGKEKAVGHEDFDTVLLAIGRYALTQQLNLDKIGVEVDIHSRKVINPPDAPGATVGDTEQSTCQHIFAVGDVLEGRPELTPVAIKAGQRLAQRIFSQTGGGMPMDYDAVPTTVFTPIEYGCVGWSEEEAEEKLGKDDLEVYHSVYTPLEWSLPSEQWAEPQPRPARNAQSTCFAKVLVARSQGDRVVGIHLGRWSACCAV